MGRLEDDVQNAKIRKRRNLAIAGVLAGIVVFIFVMTMVRIEVLYGP